MRITFEKLRFKNFMSFGNIFTEIDMAENMGILSHGANGSGKSSFLDALCFVLFGKAYRNINKPQLVNSITSKNCVVEIEFSIGSKKYKVIRGIKPGIFELYCGGVLLNPPADNRDYQAVLEKQILQLTYKSFTQLVILGSASYVPFMRLPAAARRGLVEELLDLEIFTTMNILNKKKMDDNDSEMRAVEKALDILEEKIKLTKDHLKEIAENNQALIDRKYADIEQIKLRVDGDLEYHKKVLKKIEEIQQLIPDLNLLNSKSTEMSNIKGNMLSKIKQLLKEVEFYRENDSCPTCNQTIDKKIRCDTVTDKETELAQINEAVSKFDVLYEKHSTKLKEALKLQQEVNELNLIARELYINMQHKNNQILQIQQEIKNINISAKIEDDDKLIEFEEQKEEEIKRFNKLKDDRLTMISVSNILKDDGVKSKIIQQYVPIINQLIAKYMASLELFVQFELDEEFNEKILSRGRDEFSYESFSEGEKQRIDLALLFTWRALARMKNSVNVNILIMDEVFDSSLDSSGDEQLYELVEDLSKDNSLFVISHRDRMIDKFPVQLEFTKVQNFSKMTKV